MSRSLRLYKLTTITWDMQQATEKAPLAEERAGEEEPLGLARAPGGPGPSPGGGHRPAVALLARNDRELRRLAGPRSEGK
jgi:hypothetical protein